MNTPGRKPTRFDPNVVQVEMELSEDQVKFLQNQHRVRMDVENDMGEMIADVTHKMKNYFSGRVTISPENMKVYESCVDAATRFLRLTNERDLELKKIEIKARQGMAAGIDAAELGQREMEAFLKAVITKLGPDKVRALLP